MPFGNLSLPNRGALRRHSRGRRIGSNELRKPVFDGKEGRFNVPHEKHFGGTALGKRQPRDECDLGRVVRRDPEAQERVEDAVGE
jgi:hypothetical protein